MHNLHKIPKVRLSFKPKKYLISRPVISESHAACKIFKSHWDKGLIQFLEEFKILLLNPSNQVLGIYNVSHGGTSCTIVDPKLIFTPALLSGATAIIMAYNRPSGDINPRESEKKLIKQIADAGKLLEIVIHDCLILSADDMYSFADAGFL